MKFSGTVRDMFLSLNMFSPGFDVRAFTFIPRRFTSHYWDSSDCLFTVTWWQWFRRCFCIHDRVINRPGYSSWVQICQRMNNGDLDAKLIWGLVKDIETRIVSDDRSVIYDRMVANSK